MFILFNYFIRHFFTFVLRFKVLPPEMPSGIPFNNSVAILYVVISLASSLSRFVDLRTSSIFAVGILLHTEEYDYRNIVEVGDLFFLNKSAN